MTANEPAPSMPADRIAIIGERYAALAPYADQLGVGSLAADLAFLLAEVDRLTAERDEMHCRLVVMDHDRAGLAGDLDAAQARADGLALENAELLAALRWYADEANYSTETTVTYTAVDGRMAPIQDVMVEIMADCGERARRALAGGEGMGEA